MIVFLASMLRSARVDVQCDYSPMRWDGPDRGVLQRPEGELPFRIFTNLEQLLGLRITKFAVLASAGPEWRHPSAIAEVRARGGVELVAAEAAKEQQA